MAKTLTAEERETVVLLNDAEDKLYVMTLQRKIITKLKKNPAAVLIGEGEFGGHPWAKFEMPADLLTFRNGYKSTKGVPLESNA